MPLKHEVHRPAARQQVPPANDPPVPGGFRNQFLAERRCLFTGELDGHSGKFQRLRLLDAEEKEAVEDGVVVFIQVYSEHTTSERNFHDVEAAKAIVYFGIRPSRRSARVMGS